MSDNVLNRIFSRNKWKNKYYVDWCDHCNTATIQCPKCKESSCNGSSCEECKKDFNDFTKNNLLKVENYLTDLEIDTYIKTRELKKLIVLSLSQGQNRINFNKLCSEGELSERQEIIFRHELI